MHHKINIYLSYSKVKLCCAVIVAYVATTHTNTNNNNTLLIVMSTIRLFQLQGTLKKPQF